MIRAFAWWGIGLYWWAGVLYGWQVYRLLATTEQARPSIERFTYRWKASKRCTRRSAATQHKGSPDYGLARELVDRIPVPLIISGGLDSAEGARHAYEASRADAVK